MTLITRQGKPRIKLNIEELDNNFSYLENLGDGKKQLEDLINRTKELTTDFPEEVPYKTGLIETEYVFPAAPFLIFDSIENSQPLNPSNWLGPVITEFNILCSGNEIGEYKDIFISQEDEISHQIYGLSAPIIEDGIPILGSVDYVSFWEKPAGIVTEGNVLLKSSFVDINYSYEKEDTTHTHSIYCRFGPFVIFRALVVAEESNLENLEDFEINFL